MSSILLSGPAEEPLSLAEAKAFLRVEHDDDDAVIAALVAGARIHVEAATRRALIRQTWRLARDAWQAEGVIVINPSPLRQLLAVRVYDSTGVTREVDPQSFVVDGAGARLWFAPWAVPAPGRPVGGIELDVEAGFGETAADVPEPLRQAIRLLVAHWYESRLVAALGTVSEYPHGVGPLMAPYRALAL